MVEKEEYRRNLPHIQPKEGVFFITYRLNGSLPTFIIQKLKDEREINIIKQRKRLTNNSSQLKKEIQNEKELYYTKFNKLLDNPKSGLLHLSNEKIALIVANSIHYLNGKNYKLICYTIMPNHVHLIIYKLNKPLYRILQSLKRFSAREANKILDTQGSFWQKESCDNLIHNRNELVDKIRYILNNPVKIKLVENWKDWDFSHCNPEFLSFIDD